MTLHEKFFAVPAALRDGLFSERQRLRIRKLLYNYYPAYLGTGAHIDHIGPDHQEMQIELPLNWRTKNTHGTIFGGCIYGAVDPIHTLLLMKRLGSGYEAWVKSGEVEFFTPARSTLSATVTLEDEEVEEIKTALEGQSSIERTYSVDLVDEEETTCATVETTVHVADKKNT